MRLLVVRTAGGLCNRVWGLLGGAAYASATGRSFAFVWHPTHLCGARFDRLWSAPYRQIGSRSASALARLVGVTPHPQVPFDAPGRVRMVSAGQPLLPEDPRVRPVRELLPTLHVVPELADRIEQTYEDQLLGRAVVGVMIRAHPDAY